MPYYKTCPECSAHLDPDERCDCQKKSPGNQPEDANGVHENIYMDSVSHKKD